MSENKINKRPSFLPENQSGFLSLQEFKRRAALKREVGNQGGLDKEETVKQPGNLKITKDLS